MTDQNYTLRLADLCDDMDFHSVATELRRLHDAHDWQYTMAGERLRRIEKLERINAQLLEALEDYAQYGMSQKARAAIAAAKEND